MNLRSITLRYMGWCPGVHSAARFIPDREMSSKSILLAGLTLTSILVAAVFFAFIYSKPPEWRPLKVTIDGVTYLDEEFNESFDYSTIRGKSVDFYMPFNTSDFAPATAGRQGERHVYEFQSLEEAWLFLEEWDTPRVVIGFAGWLSEGTHRDAVMRYYGQDYTGPGMMSDNPIIEQFGHCPRPRVGCYFTVERSQSVSWMPPELNATEAIKVTKMYRRSENSLSPILSLSIRLNDAPPYARFVRIPIF